MSWLYTIFIAGLLFSAGTDHGTDRSRPSQLTNKAEVSQTQQVTERFEQTYPLTSHGKVSLSNVNGAIVIEAWDRNEVRVEATKIADSKESLDLVSIDVNARPELLRIEAKYKPWDQWGEKDDYRRRKIEVQFRLMVPRNAVLSDIDSVNGSVTVSNFTNLIKISAVNGNVLATNLRGTAKLSTVNGQVRASYDSLDSGATVFCDTVNGKVNLELPSDVNATLKAESLNGEISNSFGLPVRKGKYVGRDLFGRVGNGDVQIKLSAVNGSLFIGRKKDGKNPSSVTNLLNMNSEDDDEDSDDNEEYDSAAAAAAAAEATRKSAKAVEKGLKESQKALEKMQLPDMKDVEVNVNVTNKIIKDGIATGIAQAGPLPRMIDGPLFPGTTSVDQKSRSFDVKGTPKVTVDAPMCNIRVRGWDQQVVKYVLTDAKTNREIPLSVNENVNDNTVTIKLSNGARRRSMMFGEGEERDRLEVYVPRKSDIRVASSHEIRIESVNGNIDIDGEDESVSVRDSEGTLRLSNGDGLIRVVGFKGDLELKSGDSEIYLEGDFSKIDSCAVDAKITLTMPQNKSASISTNTAIESEGLNIVRESDHTWRLGNGGPKYNFDFSGGTLVVRNQTRIETN